MFVGWSGADTPSHLNLALVQPEPLAVTGPVLAPHGMPGGMLSLSDRRLRVGAPKPARAPRGLQAAE